MSTRTALVPGAHLRISRSYPARRVLTDITLTVSQGEWLALIGENGTGKSTLLRIAAGIEHPDNGSVEVPDWVGLLWQQPTFALTDTGTSSGAHRLVNADGLVVNLGCRGDWADGDG